MVEPLSILPSDSKSQLAKQSSLLFALQQTTSIGSASGLVRWRRVFCEETTLIRVRSEFSRRLFLNGADYACGAYRR
jgi:hypothetical protein